MQNSIDQLGIGMRRAFWMGLLLLWIAAPAHANQIVQVRVGNHPNFTRLVFEMDAFAGYQVERRTGLDGAEQLTVTLEASTPTREITSKSLGIESVSIAAGKDHAVAQIRLRKSGLQMKEMILSNPPRIVLDFVHSAAAVAELTGDPYAKPAPAEPKPVVAKVVEPKPEPKPVVAKIVAPKPEPVSVPVDPEASAEALGMADSAQDSEAAASSLAADADRRALRDSIPGAHKRRDLEPPTDSTAESTSEQVADAAGADLDAPRDPSPRILLPATNDAQQRRAPSPSDINRRADKPKPADSGLPFSAMTLAGIAAGVLAVLFIAVRLFRRRSLPQDLDVTTFAGAFDDDAEASDGETSDQIPAEGFTLNDSPTHGSAPEVEEQNTAAYSLSEVAANQAEPETGLYNEDSEGEKPMDMETTDLPTERDDFGVPPVGMMNDADSGLSQLVQELASRIANLESRLDEANDSRERLERQVAAQSEELRVQRAAIARTQRALRSLSRSEEEQATEPALREPSQPAK